MAYEHAKGRSATVYDLSTRDELGESVLFDQECGALTGPAK